MSDETDYLMSSPANAKRLEEGIAQAGERIRVEDGCMARLSYLLDVLRGCWDLREEYTKYEDMFSETHEMYEDGEAVEITKELLDEIEENLSKIKGL